MSRAERRFVWTWTAVLLAAVFAPVAHGYWVAPPGWDFAGFVGREGSDHYAAFSWIRQAVDGEVLFRSLYTTEPHGRRVLLPLFWLMGALARASGAPVIALWYAVQALACAALVGGAYRFSAELSEDVPTRKLATLLATTASGLGFAAAAGDLPGRPIDTWMPEASAFGALAGSPPSLPLSLGLLLFALARALRYRRGGRRRDAAAAGALALGAGAVHPPALVPFYALAGAWLATRPGRRVGGLWLAGLPAPLALYWALAPALDPVLSRLHPDPPAPSLGALALGLGLPLALALAAAPWPAVRREHPRLGLLLAWPALAGLGLALPLGCARGFTLGLQVPLCLLAAMGACTLFRRVARDRGDASLRGEIGAALAAALVALCALGSFAAWLGLFRQNALQWPGRYLPAGYAEAFRWLDAHGEPGEVVLAAPVLARRLPGRTGLAVFEGHFALTLDRLAKERFARALFRAPGPADPEGLAAVLARNRVRYVAADRVSAGRYGLSPLGSRYPFLPLVEPVYRNAWVEVFEVRAERRGDPGTPWAGGSWRGP